MSTTTKNRTKLTANIPLIESEDRNALSEVLHRSTKTCKTTKKMKNYNLYLHPGIIGGNESDLDMNRRSASNGPVRHFRSKCPCETHFDKTLIEHNYNINGAKLFDLIFGNNEFVETYRKAQRIYDDKATEWIVDVNTEQRERLLTYKVPYESTFVGKGIISTSEKQKVLHEEKGSCYVVETEVVNTGVKFSDTFSLVIRYCIVQTHPQSTKLHVTAQVRFCKSLNGLIKQMIERNAYSATQESLKDLNNRLNLVSKYLKEKRRSIGSETNLPVPPTNRRPSRHDALGIVPEHPCSDPGEKTEHESSLFSQPNNVIYLFLFILGFLSFIHLYLFMKLNNMDNLVDSLEQLIKVSSLTSTKRRH